jgi:hypothetical protein
VDAAGADLSRLVLSPDADIADVAAGVLWDDNTIWPTATRRAIERRSRELRAGVYQVDSDTPSEPRPLFLDPPQLLPPAVPSAASSTGPSAAPRESVAHVAVDGADTARHPVHVGPANARGPASSRAPSAPPSSMPRPSMPSPSAPPSGHVIPPPRYGDSPRPAP